MLKQPNKQGIIHSEFTGENGESIMGSTSRNTVLHPDRDCGPECAIETLSHHRADIHTHASLIK